MRKGITISNENVYAGMEEIQKLLSKELSITHVGMQRVIEYLLSNYYWTRDQGISLNVEDFRTKVRGYLKRSKGYLAKR